MENERGKLFLVTNHIGNRRDLTFRAKDTLIKCDVVLCEDRKVGSQTLRDLSLTKEIEEFSVDNEEEKSIEVIERLKKGESFGVLSDAGMPIFADPGSALMRAAINAEIEVELVPGVTSIMTALVRSGFDLEEFLYAGFLSRKTGERLEKLEKLSKEQRTVAFLETPYRLMQILEACAKIMPSRNAYIGMNLTMFNETHHYGTFAELLEKFYDNRVKAEFVICFEGYSEAGKADDEEGGNRFIRKRKFSTDRSEVRDRTAQRQNPGDEYGNYRKWDNKEREIQEPRSRDDRERPYDNRDSGSRDYREKRDTEKRDYFSRDASTYERKRQPRDSRTAAERFKRDTSSRDSRDSSYSRGGSDRDFKRSDSSSSSSRDSKYKSDSRDSAARDNRYSRDRDYSKGRSEDRSSQSRDSRYKSDSRDSRYSRDKDNRYKGKSDDRRTYQSRDSKDNRNKNDKREGKSYRSDDNRSQESRSYSSRHDRDDRRER